MLKRKWLIITAICCSVVVMSSGQNIDSLKIELYKTQEETTQLQLMADIAHYSLKSDLKEAYNIAKKGLRLSKKIRNKEKELEFTNTIAKTYLFQNNLEPVSILLDSIFEHTDFTSLKKEKATLKLTQGSLCYYKSDMINAAKCFENAGNLYLEAGLIEESEAASLNLGTILLHSREVDKAEGIFTELTKSNNPITKYTAYQNLGSVFGYKKDSQKAILNFNRAINIGEKNQLDVGGVYLNLGIENEKVGKPRISLNNYKKAEELASKQGNTKRLGMVYYNLGSLYLELEQPSESVKYIEKAFDFLNAENLTELREYHDIRSRAYTILKNHKEANTSLYKVIEITDTLFNREKLSIVAETQSKFQTEKKEAENQLLQKDKELQAATIQRQRTTLLGTVGGLGLLCLLSFLLYRQSNERKRNNQLLSDKNEKIELLHQELGHRVKNNLAFISAMMDMQGRRLENKEAKQAVKESESRIEAMSLLHRKLHLQEDNNKVNIGHYLKELCDNLQYTFPYMGQQPQIRLESDDLMMDGEPAVRLGLIVNELVTNSFKYAFREQENPQINIRVVSTDRGHYQMTYHDNGVGLPANFDLTKSKSLGLKLIHTLTKQLNGQVNISHEQKGVNYTFGFTKSKIAV